MGRDVVLGGQSILNCGSLGDSPLCGRLGVGDASGGLYGPWCRYDIRALLRFVRCACSLDSHIMLAIRCNQFQIKSESFHGPLQFLCLPFESLGMPMPLGFEAAAAYKERRVSWVIPANYP